jgi:hypothetical protein
MSRSAKVNIVYFIGADPQRNRVEITTPKPLNKKTFELLQSALSRAAWKVLTSRHRRRKVK